jgi:hypothetical protein
MGRKLGSTWVVSLAVLFGVGCAGVQPAPTPDAQELVLRRPPEQIWPELERLLHDKGWELEPRQGDTLTTAWRQRTEDQLVPGGTGEVRVERVVALAKPLVGGSSSVRLVRQTRMMRILELGKSIGANPQAQKQGRNYTAGTGWQYHNESQQGVGPEQPLRADREADLEQELATRLASRAP